MSGRVIVVSNRLPLSIVERGRRLVADRSIGGLATALAPVFERYQPSWVGWTGLHRALTNDELESLNLPKAIIPVQLEKSTVEQYYDCIANRVLWPTLHGLPVSCPPFEANWPAYQQVSKSFAAATQTVAAPDDVVWIHDYHLFLLPKDLRQAGLESRLGFFLHTPFPPPEHLFKLAFSREIMDSLCEVDVLGLQTNRDVENFWACLKVAGTQKQPGLVRAFPIGIDWQGYARAAEIVEVKAEKKAMLKREGKRSVILSISRLDYTKGILTQLAAVEKFFESSSNPEQFVYRLSVAPSRENVPEYADLKQAIQEAVKRINKSLGNRRWQPVDYSYENLNFAGMNACYLAAEALLLTPVNDGMNLIAKEYVAARSETDGMMVLSNQVGAAAQLRDALLVDAHDVQAIAKALQTAFDMPEDERLRRWEGLRAAVRDKDVFWWTENFLKALMQT